MASQTSTPQTQASSMPMDPASSDDTPVSPPSPTAVFDKVFSGADKRPVVLFDGICGFCNRGIDTTMALDRSRRLRFTPLQSEVGKGLLRYCGRQEDDLSSMVVIDSTGQHYLKSDAALRIAREITPFPFLGRTVEALGSFLIPRLVRDGLYDQVADNRYSILGTRECRTTDPEEDDRFL